MYNEGTCLRDGEVFSKIYFKKKISDVAGPVIKLKVTPAFVRK